jgi:hypothetical protein
VSAFDSADCGLSQAGELAKLAAGQAAALAFIIESGGVDSDPASGWRVSARRGIGQLVRWLAEHVAEIIKRLRAAALAAIVTKGSVSRPRDGLKEPEFVLFDRRFPAHF